MRGTQLRLEPSGRLLRRACGALSRVVAAGCAGMFHGWPHRPVSHQLFGFLQGRCPILLTRDGIARARVSCVHELKLPPIRCSCGGGRYPYARRVLARVVRFDGAAGAVALDARLVARARDAMRSFVLAPDIQFQHRGMACPEERGSSVGGNGTDYGRRCQYINYSFERASALICLSGSSKLLACDFWIEKLVERRRQ